MTVAVAVVWEKRSRTGRGGLTIINNDLDVDLGMPPPQPDEQSTPLLIPVRPSDTQYAELCQLP
jgi:hypothetical protein